MILANVVVQAGMTLAVTGVLWAVRSLWSRDKDNAAAHRDRLEGMARDHETWFKESEDLYERVKSKCDECTVRLDRVEAALEGILEDLDDQILPMLMLPDVNPMDTRNAMRAAMRKARERVREP